MKITPMNPKTQRFWIILFLIALTVITGLVTVRRSIKQSNDFDTFYEAGKSVLQGRGIYYSGEYYEDTKEQGPFLYPPFAACFFALFAWMPLALAAFLWNTFNVACFAACLKIILQLSNESKVPWNKLWRGASVKDRCLGIGVSFALLLDNLSMAQVNIVVFLLCLCGLRLWRRQKHLGAGIVLASAITIKLTPALFVLFFILKRQWKVLAGILLGMFLFTLLIPTLIFGFETNRIYHRQWAGRTLKPILIRISSQMGREIPHPLKKSVEVFQYDHLTSLLNQKNQSLPASVTRLLLKDRVRFGYSPYPIYVARRYEKLPVLFGGIPETALSWLIQGLRGVLVCLMSILWWPRKSGSSPFSRSMEMGLVFLGMTLLPPWCRSHQFVSWLFVYGMLLIRSSQMNLEKDRLHSYDMNWLQRLMKISTVSILFYASQALPYGKALGMGTGANLVLFFGLSWELLRLRYRRTLVTQT